MNRVHGTDEGEKKVEDCQGKNVGDLCAKRTPDVNHNVMGFRYF